MSKQAKQKKGLLQSVGLGLITGAADDDCSAIGTYAQTGAQLGYAGLWTAPVTLPMMVAVVYLSGKLGLVTGEGLFCVLRRAVPRWLLFAILVLVLVGNIIEAGADIGGMAAGLGLLIHVPGWVLILGVGLIAVVVQVWGSFKVIRNILRVLAMSLLAYIVSALLSHPQWGEVVRGTFAPHFAWNRETLAILVAIIGTALSAYIYTWQSNEEVEQKIEDGKRTVQQRRALGRGELKASLWDVLSGMIFSALVMYAIILCTAATLHVHGVTQIDSATQAAQALVPLAGRAAGLLFTLGLVGVGFLAVPVMTTGAAYDLCQSMGWRNGLAYKPKQAPVFYATIALFTLVAMAINFAGVNPMHALVTAGIVQGFSTPPLMLLIMVLTNRKDIMGKHVNGWVINTLGGITTAIIFTASICLLYSYLHH